MNKLTKLYTGIKIASAILKAKYIRPVPIFCQWEITYDCNMNCKFCTFKLNKKMRKEYPELGTEGAIDIIKQLDDIGAKIINFSGGEPTLRRDLPMLIHEIKKRGMSVFFSTNGSTLKYTAANVLEADAIRVSIDGPEKIHDSIRRYPGAFKDAVEGIKSLKKYGNTPTIVTATSNLLKYEDMEYMVKIAKSLGVYIDFSMIGFSIPSYKVNPKESDMVKEQLDLVSEKKWFIESIIKLKKEYGDVVSDPSSYLEIFKAGSLANIGCKALTSSITIKPSGIVGLPCDIYTLKLCKGKLKDIYFSKETEKIRKNVGKYWFCKYCHSRCMGLSSMMLDFRKLLNIIKSYKNIS